MLMIKETIIILLLWVAILFLLIKEYAVAQFLMLFCILLRLTWPRDKA